MNTLQHSPTVTDLSPELLCHILQFLPLKEILSVAMLCRKLLSAVNMYFRLCKSIDFCPDSVSGYMPSTITDDHMHALLKKCPLLETVYGLHPVKVERRRLRKRSALTVPGIIEALNLCFHLKAIETSDLKLFEAIMQHIPQLEIIGHFQNRDGVFPPHASQKLKLHPYPRVTSLHLIGVEVPELTAMPHLQHLHLQCVRFTKLQPFRAFLAQNLKSFTMKHCIGPAMSLRYLSLIIALSSSPNLRHLELVRVPLPGGLFQRAVEDSHRHNGFVNLRTLVIAGCKGVLEADLGHLMIVSSKFLQTLFIQPSLTKDSLFVSLSYAQCTFPSLRNLHLGYMDNLNNSGEWSNDALLSFGLAEIPDTPSSITDSGMKVISQLLPRIKSLSVSNCPHLMVMYQWMPGNNVEPWSELTDLTLQKCHCLQLSSFTVFVSLLPSIQVITLNEMFKEPPKGCSHVGLSAGTGLGMSSAVVSNQDEHIAVQGHQQEFDHPGEEENEEIEREVDGDNEDNLEPHFMVLRGDFFEEDDDIVYIDYENRNINEAAQRQEEEYSSEDSSQSSSSSDDYNNEVVYFEGEYVYFPPPPVTPPPQMQLPPMRPPPQLQLPPLSPPPPYRSNRSRRASSINVRKNSSNNSQYHLRQTPKRVQQSKSVGVQANGSIEFKSADSDKMSEDSGRLNSSNVNYDPHKPSTSRAGRHLDYSYPMSSDSELDIDFKLNENSRKSKKVSNNQSFSKKRQLSNVVNSEQRETKCFKTKDNDSSDSGYILDTSPSIISHDGAVNRSIDTIENYHTLSADMKLVKPCSVVLIKIEDGILEVDKPDIAETKKQISDVINNEQRETKYSKFKDSDSSDSEYLLGDGSVTRSMNSIESENDKLVKPCSVVLTKIEDGISDVDKPDDVILEVNEPDQPTKNIFATSSSGFSPNHTNVISCDNNYAKKESKPTDIDRSKSIHFPNASECLPLISQKKEFSRCCVHIDRIKFPFDRSGTICNPQISPNLQGIEMSPSHISSTSAEFSQTTKVQSAMTPKGSNDVPQSVSCKYEVSSNTSSENSDLDQKYFTGSIKRKKVQSSKFTRRKTLKYNKNESLQAIHSEKRTKFLKRKGSELATSNQYNPSKIENEKISEELFSTSSRDDVVSSADGISIEGGLKTSNPCFCNICQQPSTSKGIKHNCKSSNEFYNFSNEATNLKPVGSKFSSTCNSVPLNCYVRLERLKDETLNLSFKTEYEKIKQIDCSSIKIPQNFIEAEDNSFKISASNNNFEGIPTFSSDISNLPEPKNLKEYQGKTRPNIQPDYYIDISDNSLHSIKIVDSSTGKTHEISSCKVLVSKFEDEKSFVPLTSVARKNKSKKRNSDPASDTQTVTSVEYNPYLPSTSSANNIDMTCKSTDMPHKNNSTNGSKPITKHKKIIRSSRHCKQAHKGKMMSNNDSSSTSTDLSHRDSEFSIPEVIINKPETYSECSQNVSQISDVKSLKIKNSDVAIILRRENSDVNDSPDINNNSFCRHIKTEDTTDCSESNVPINSCIEPQCSSPSKYLEEDNKPAFIKSEIQPRRFSERIHNRRLASQKSSCISKPKETIRPVSRRYQKRKNSFFTISMISQGTQANSADIRRSVRRIRRVHAHRSVAPSCYSSATGKISSKATSKKRIYKNYDPETMDKATSTSDPLLEDDAVQVLQLSSDTLLSFTIVACGISNLIMDRCPKLFHLEVQACRILKKLELNMCPSLKRLNISQCPKLGISELSTAVLTLVTDSYFLVSYEPCMQSYDPGDGEREVLSKASTIQSVLLCHDFYDSSDENIQALFQERLLSWLHYMSRLHLGLKYTREKNYRKKPDTLYSLEYPWYHDIRRIHGQYVKTSSELCSTEGHYNLLTNCPIFCDIFETYNVNNEFPSVNDCEAYRNNSLLSYEAIEKYLQIRKKFLAFYIPITKYNRTETYKLVS